MTRTISPRYPTPRDIQDDILIRHAQQDQESSPRRSLNNRRQRDPVTPSRHRCPNSSIDIVKTRLACPTTNYTHEKSAITSQDEPRITNKNSTHQSTHPNSAPKQPNSHPHQTQTPHSQSSDSRSPRQAPSGSDSRQAPFPTAHRSVPRSVACCCPGRRWTLWLLSQGRHCCLEGRLFACSRRGRCARRWLRCL